MNASQNYLVLKRGLAGWLDATVAFMKSGGYKVSKKIKDVRQDTLVVWGAEDEILDPKSGSLFAEKLPQSKYAAQLFRL